MKILYHHRTQARDGCIVHIGELIAALRALGHEVVVVAPPGTEGGPAADTGSGGPVDRLRRALPKAAFELLEFLYAFHAFARLYRAFRRHRPDVLYERYNLYTPTGAWLKRLTGLPVLLEVNAPLAHERAAHGGLALTPLARWTERLAWRSADRVLPVTSVLADHVRAAGVPDGRIAVIPNGVDPRRFAADAAHTAAAKARLGLEGRLVLGFTGFVREWHRLEQVVDVLAEPGPGACPHLLLVGDGPARAGIEERARQRGVADRVTVTGVLPHDAIPGHVAAFDIALQPAVTAYASPLKLFEYMQAGRAIVAPDAPNIREVLRHDGNALLFDPADPAAFGHAVRRLCRDGALRARLGAQARATIAERQLTWDGNARRVAALFEERLAGTVADAVGTGSRRARPDGC
ncbi:MAG TPA: glycosyltransferase family 4 protein [Azospirillum sp.]|nr:glycosyltransferase family 4 protein [Azospirillum sp.]